MTNSKFDVFQDLFQYRQRERRTPLEDFLTAAFIGFVRTMSSHDQMELAAALFVPLTARDKFKDSCRQSASCRWDIQLVLPSGKRPDIVFWLDRTPVIVIENKIWSAIAIHNSSTKQADEDNEEDHNVSITEAISKNEVSQLATYGNWLRKARIKSSWPGSLALLTHGTLPPADFQTDNITTYGSIPHTCRWSNIYTWIKQFVRRESLAGRRSSASAFLGDHLANFVQSKGLAMKSLSYADIDALGAHFALRKPLEATFAETLAAIRSSFPEMVAANGAKAIKYEKSGSIVWGWVYLESKGIPKSTYFAWGFRFPGVSSWWEDLADMLPEENQVFCCIASDNKSFRTDHVPESIRPTGWLVSNEGKELFCAATLSSLPAAQTLQQAFALWTVSQLQSLRPMIGHISTSNSVLKSTAS